MISQFLKMLTFWKFHLATLVIVMARMMTTMTNSKAIAAKSNRSSLVRRCQAELVNVG